MDTYAICHEAHVKRHKINQKQNQYPNLQNPDTKKFGVLSEGYCESTSNIGHNFAKGEKKSSIFSHYDLHRLLSRQVIYLLLLFLCMCFIRCVMTHVWMSEVNSVASSHQVYGINTSSTVLPH